MKVDVKCFATLTKSESCNFENATAYEIEDGNNVKDLIDKTDLPADRVALTFVNGRKASVDTTLSDGDRVGFFPAVGGM